MLIIIFSKDRALQLSATIDSLLATCKETSLLNIYVLYTTSSELHEQQYRELDKQYLNVKFRKETRFKENLISILLSGNYPYVLFCVDDTIFIKKFSIKEITNHLHIQEGSLGFSLRLGLNTTYCYMLDKPQILPKVDFISDNVIKYNWVTAEYDFEYPLELSSSVYKTYLILALIRNKEFHNPNSLESLLNVYKTPYKNIFNELLCYKVSVAFSNPCNIVQVKKTNRHGKLNADDLAIKFSEGYRLDISKYYGLVTSSVHQEEPLYFKEI